ncbi:MAG: dephospho-CoA kinase [Flavobacteriales bacterium]|jgi:dephospho-CoA kinase|nr:dephospho-CoA kinase [Flavobacteriales bacterium]
MDQDNMLKIGLTGGIGSGKTTVASIFNSFGIPIYNSDIRAKYIMNHDVELIKAIQHLLGDEAYLNGKINRPYISKKVFSTPALLQQLNQLVHPKVAEDFDHWCNENSHAPFIIKEAAILIESKAYLSLDKIIVVNAPEAIRITRVMQRDHTPLEAVKARIKNQISEEERNQYADFIVNNDGKTALIKQVKAIIKALKALQ